MFVNSIIATFAGLLLVLTASVHAKSLSSTDVEADLQRSVSNLRQSIQNIVNQTAQGLDFSDLQDDIVALTADVTELQNALRVSFEDTLESYDEAGALDTLIRGTLRKLVQQNPDVAAMVLGQGPASGSGSKLTVAIDMVDLLEKELEEIDVASIEKVAVNSCDENGVKDCLQAGLMKLRTQAAKDAESKDYTETCRLVNVMLDCIGSKANGCSGSIKEGLEKIRSKYSEDPYKCTVSDTVGVSGVVARLFTLSEAVMNTAEWMDQAVNSFVEILESVDLEAEHSENQHQEQTRQKRSPGGFNLGGGWSLGGHGIQYGRGSWTVSAGPTFGGGKIGGRVGFRIRF